MVISTERSYSKDDLQVLDLVDHPVWVFDVVNKCMWWANQEAVSFWNANSLEELLNRDFATDMSEVVAKKNLDTLERLKRKERVKESWTYYPSGSNPKTASISQCGIHVESGELCMFCEAFPVDHDKIDPQFVRSAVTLHYLPLAVCQFNVNGELTYQNPEAYDTFGSAEYLDTLEEAKTPLFPTAGNGGTNITVNNIKQNPPPPLFNSNPNPEHPSQVQALFNSNPKPESSKLPPLFSSTPKSGASKVSPLFSSNPKPEVSTVAPLFGSNPPPSENPKVSPLFGNTASENPKVAPLFGNPEPESLKNSDQSNKIDTTTDSATSQGSDKGSKVKITPLFGSPAFEKSKPPEQNSAMDTITDFASAEPVSEESKVNDTIVPKKNHFLRRFADRKRGKQILDEIMTGKDVSVEALVHTRRGKEWNAIHARLGKDSLTSDPIILFSARDISEIVNAKKETQVNKERAEFFAILAHEIRTPLFQVTGFVDLLDQTSLTDEQHGYVKLLKTSAMSMMTVINDVLDFSKLEAGKLKLDVVPFEPKAVVDGALAAVLPSVEEKGLNLTHSFPKGVPVKLMGDPNRLRQILLNLLGNAVKFTHNGDISAKIEMLKEDELGRVLLKFSVTDTGIGIDSNNLSNIFRKYSQAAPAIANFYGGTGLGLSISKSLVSGMGGTIGVDSEVGKGSKFWFQIPFLRPKVTPQIPKELDAQDKISNLKILVAEDNGVSQKLISKMLSRLGHVPTIVENGELAVNEVQANSFDLILMDIQMPVMDGIDATKEIRSMGKKLPIVGLSASVRREDFLDIGLNDWISKPVRLKELQSKISEVLKEFNNGSG